MKHLRTGLAVTAVLAGLYLAWVFATRHSSTKRWTARQEEARGAVGTTEIERLYRGSELKILNFYLRDSTIAPGGSTLLCYGVVNAGVVRLNPPVADLYPSINRCVEVAPPRDTTYTLTAEAGDGRVTSKSVFLRVGPRR